MKNIKVSVHLESIKDKARRSNQEFWKEVTEGWETGAREELKAEHVPEFTKASNPRCRKPNAPHIGYIFRSSC